MRNILCVDDDSGTRESIKAVLEDRYNVFLAGDVKEAREILRKGSFDIILLDQALPEISGLTFLEELKNLIPGIPVLMITAVSLENTLAEALRLGAVGLIAKPFDIHELRHLVQQSIAASREPRAQAILQKGEEEVFPVRSPIGISAPFQKMLRIANELAKDNVPIFISGEKGVGKELIARHIHALGPRSSEPFYTVRCRQHSEESLVRELFGVTTPDHIPSKGAVDLAGSGCLYLDGGEVISRALKERIFSSLSAQENGPLCRARVIISSNNFNDYLKNSPNSNTEDLNAHHLQIPPLRERREDLPLLAYHFVHEFRHNLQSGISAIGSEAIQFMKMYSWPGNVRELRNVIERACLVYSTEKELQPAHLPKEISLALPATIIQTGLTYEQMVDDFERAIIVHTLERTSGNITKAAELLGTTIRVVSYRINTLNLKKYTNGK
ncbi:two-component system, NtrC family, response regulator/two-component system, NtrC family, response regulator HydG/two-component system, NtrC family, response regulator AtoC [Verrucomicrobium sp. GAS474]|uniref:sigma-54-dependent transcriptional regulator n=1 Tax=Verrucomicrobium sp. GAS474 TaxID=1882831 RepID=UPI00087D996D|nr:sigma-54 dependent transcriptional regulator [Verrucomicrobium sp. GAS474]SDT93114.1 two-component system, NtrC family, response regulator/two-component system, NtrC family, response regulator HydG/two-component system, NtrC family, response regulator AtoC [Verrucomicrobium sp. GAS474]